MPSFSEFARAETDLPEFNLAFHMSSQTAGTRRSMLRHYLFGFPRRDGSVGRLDEAASIVQECIAREVKSVGVVLKHLDDAATSRARAGYVQMTPLFRRIVRYIFRGVVFDRIVHSITKREWSDDAKEYILASTIKLWQFHRLPYEFFLKNVNYNSAVKVEIIHDLIQKFKRYESNLRKHWLNA